MDTYVSSMRGGEFVYRRLKYTGNGTVFSLGTRQRV